MKQRNRILVIAVIIMATMLGGPATAAVQYGTWQNPFAANSIWNTPIGSAARLVSARIKPASGFAADIIYLVRAQASDRLRPVYEPGDIETRAGYCGGTNLLGQLLIADNFVLPGAVPGDTPNNNSAFLSIDGQFVTEIAGLARCRAAGRVTGYLFQPVPINGNGLGGAHGGSGLSALGGTIRTGELTGTGPIPHALKIELWAARYYFRNPNALYRWPAEKADSYAIGNYGGTFGQIRPGSLLVLNRSLSAGAIGIQTTIGAKIFEALVRYGAYIADDTFGDYTAMPIESAAYDEALASFGYEFDSQPVGDDINRILSNLLVVTNNGPRAIGGGGTPVFPRP